MTNGQRYILLVAAHLMEYPDATWFENISQWRTEIFQQTNSYHYTTYNEQLFAFLDRISKIGLLAAQEEYVTVFDHDPATSIYLAWHRYGNDRGQGKAMAALNALYRTQGYKPVANQMPDYLPIMLEFLALCEDWAAETLLDGFGPELAALKNNLQQISSSYANVLECALLPLQEAWPKLFLPRTKPDTTIRPMANPIGESAIYCHSHSGDSAN